jgi:hypothetical protein
MTSIDIADVAKWLLPVVAKHTGTIVYTPKNAELSAHYGCASCVFVEHRNRRLAITCGHVTRDASSVRILAIQPSPQPTPLGPVTQLLPARILRENAEHDLAILDAQTIDFVVAQKKPFLISTADQITQTFLERELGVLCFIWGVLGSSTEVVPSGRGAYVEVPIYSNGGSIKTITQMAIIGEFREEQVQLVNDALFPQLADTTISGGSRDLSGMSGSGLWIAGEVLTYSLAGILKGPASGNIGDPEVRFIPAWTLRAILDEMGSNDSASDMPAAARK